MRNCNILTPAINYQKYRRINTHLYRHKQITLYYFNVKSCSKVLNVPYKNLLPQPFHPLLLFQY